VENRLWLPLAGLMLSRGVSLLFHVVRPELLARIERTLFPRRPVRIHVPAESVGSEIAMLYVRLVIMQLAIIVGAFLAIALGTMAPFVILIVLKTAVDVVIHLAVDLREQSVPVGAAPAATRS
jgi:hypothetical protein